MTCRQVRQGCTISLVAVPQEVVKDPYLYRFQYKDGLRGSILLLNGCAAHTAAAAAASRAAELSRGCPHVF